MTGGRAEVPGVNRKPATWRLLPLLILLAFPARAATYYVESINGSDANAGTSTGLAWQHAPGMASCTATCASTTLNAGDSVLLEIGDIWYNVALTMPSSGASGNPITYGTYGGGEVQINWTPQQNANVTSQNVYRAAQPGGPYALLASVGATTSQYQDMSPLAGTDCYGVTTLMGTMESALSIVQCAQPFANPILKGANYLNTSGFALAPNTFTTIYQHASSGSHEGNLSQPINFRLAIPANNPSLGIGFSNAATFISVSVTAGPTTNLQISGMAIGPGVNPVGSGAGNYPAASALTPITWSGSATVTIPAGTTVSSDYINYALDNSVVQVLTLYAPTPNVAFYANNGEALWELFSGGNQSQALNPGGFAYSGGLLTVAQIVNQNITAHAYRGALGVTPTAMWEDGALLKLANNPLGVDQTAGSWFYDGTYVYIHAFDSSVVGANGHKYDYVTASSPSFIAWDNAQSYLVWNGIDVAETYNTSSATLGGLYLTGSNSLVENMAGHDTYRHPFCFYTGGTSNTATNVTFYNSYGTSPVCIYGSGTQSNLLENCTLYNDTYLRAAYVVTGSVWSVLVAHGGSTGNTVDSCVIWSTAGPYRSNINQSHGYGLLVGDSGTTLIASHNFLYGNFEWGIYLGQQGDFGAGPGGQITLWDNVINCATCYLSASGGAAYFAYGGASGSLLYDNTMYAPLATAAAIQIQSTTTGTLVKNNIVDAGGSYLLVDTASETSAALDYNDWYGTASSTPFSWGGTAYSFAGYKSAASQDAHSITGNPLFVNPGAAIFPIGSGSPAINAGVSLGNTYKLTLLPAASWPSSVSTQNQGTNWEMGAYLYVGGSGPPGGVADQVAPIAVGP